jgi:hypothetical protein
MGFFASLFVTVPKTKEELNEFLFARVDGVVMHPSSGGSKFRIECLSLDSKRRVREIYPSVQFEGDKTNHNAQGHKELMILTGDEAAAFEQGLSAYRQHKGKPVQQGPITDQAELPPEQRKQAFINDEYYQRVTRVTPLDDGGLEVQFRYGNQVKETRAAKFKNAELQPRTEPKTDSEPVKDCMQSWETIRLYGDEKRVFLEEYAMHQKTKDKAALFCLC